MLCGEEGPQWVHKTAFTHATSYHWLPRESWLSHLLILIRCFAIPMRCCFFILIDDHAFGIVQTKGVLGFGKFVQLLCNTNSPPLFHPSPFLSRRLKWY